MSFLNKALRHRSKTRASRIARPLNFAFIFDVYVFKRCFVRAVGLTVILSMMLLIVQLLGMLDFLVVARNVATTTAIWCLLILPAMFVVMAPLAILVSIFQVYGDLRQDHELAIIIATGRSPLRTAAPALAMAALFACLCLVISIVVEPMANRLAAELQTRISGDMVQQAVQAGGFRRLAAGVQVRVGENGPRGELRDVLIVDTQTPHVQKIYAARTGRIDDLNGKPVLVLGEGWLLSRGDAGALPTQIEFQNYNLMLTDLGVEFVTATFGLKHKSTGELFAECRVTCNRPNDATVIEINRRLTDWLQVLAFATIALAFAVNPAPARSAHTIRFAIGLAFALIIRGFGFFALSQSGGSMAMTLAVYVVPLGATAFGLMSLSMDGLRPTNVFRRYAYASYRARASAHAGRTK